MSEVVGAAAAHRYRDQRQAKARRLGDGDDARNVDASSFTPGEPLDADAKTGMRPVSRQARKDGGAVTGRCAGGRADRPARRAGGGVGESYVNRNAKEANEDRAGRKHDMGLKKGGRARKAGGGGFGMLGGLLPLAISEMSGGDNDPNKNDALGPVAAAAGKARGGGINEDKGVYKPDKEREGASFTRRAKEESGSSAVETRLGRASGGRAHRDVGGPLATPLSAGMGGQGRFNFNYGPQTSEASKLGIKNGGYVGRERAHQRYGPGPGPAEHHPGLARANGGAITDDGLIRKGTFGPLSNATKAEVERIKNTPPEKGLMYPADRRALARSKRANGGPVAGPAEGPSAIAPDTTASAAPGPAESSYAGPRYNRKAVQSAIDSSNRRGQRIGGKEARMIHALLKGHQRGDYASGGEVAEKALAAHHAEHKAMAKGKHGPDCDCSRCTARKAKGGLLSAFGAMSKASGGRASHARGGKAGKGTKINIIIAPGGANPQPPPGAGGLPPNLALKPPPAAPMPMPAPGGAPPGASPMPMPIPIPMGGGMPGAGMAGGASPPRARGGRAPRIKGDPMAGSGSGLGRLQKAHEYGTEGPPGRSA